MKKRAASRKFAFLSTAALVTMFGLTSGTGAFAEEAQYVGNPNPDYSASEIKVNQIGYLPNEKKIAIVTGESGTDYKIINQKTEKIVKRGVLKTPVFDENSGDYVRHIDFSSIKKEGTYSIKVNGIGSSYDFSIDDEVYEDAFFKVARSYTLQRSNTAIEDQVTGLTLAAGHGQDQEASMFFTDAFLEKGEKIDVEGGWYDAGDYGKYIPPAAVTVAQLLMAYEMNPDEFTKGQFSFPSSISNDSNLPDALAEVKFELDWMQKMQRPDGAVYHKVSGVTWSGWVTPEEDSQDRLVYGMSTYGTAMYAGTMAQAARVFEAYDKEYASQLLANAEKAQEYLETHPEAEFRMDEGQNNSSGPYDKYTDREERLWAAAELLKTTHDKKYDQYLQENFSDLFSKKPTFISWGDAQTLGQWAYVTSSNGDPEVKKQIKKAFVDVADEILAQVKQDGYLSTLGASDYTWASNKNAVAKGNLLLMANELQKKEKYVDAALEQLHYIFGRNATDTSYVTGTGDNPVVNPHHRISRSTNLIVPGLLVGGPNGFGGDPDIEAYVANTNAPAAKAYLDYFNSWATNEYAIDYNAPLYYMLSYFNAQN